MKVILGTDHAGVDFKRKIYAYLESLGDFELTDLDREDLQKDYPDVAAAVCREVAEHRQDFGILICGTGIGMSIAANKIRGIRAAAITESFGAKYARLHNDANIICLGARVTGPEAACDLTELFLKTGFEGGRHKGRIDKIAQLEESDGED